MLAPTSALSCAVVLLQCLPLTFGNWTRVSAPHGFVLIFSSFQAACLLLFVSEKKGCFPTLSHSNSRRGTKANNDYVKRSWKAGERSRPSRPARPRRRWRHALFSSVTHRYLQRSSSKMAVLDWGTDGTPLQRPPVL